MSDEREVLTVPEVARVLRIAPVTVYKAAQRGEIPHVKIGDRVLFPRVQLDAMLRGEKVAA